MRYLILVKATAESAAEPRPAAQAAFLIAMTHYRDQLNKAGVLLDGNSLRPGSHGCRIRYDGDQRSVINTPFAKTSELIAGYTLIQVKSREEALEWARRHPNPSSPGQPAEIEIRQLDELEDFAPSRSVDCYDETGATK